MYIERFLENKILKYLNRKEIIAVIGARQCGKTTMLRHVFETLKNALFIDFEDREKLELFTEDIDSFIELYVKNYNYLFIDEFQYAREGGKQLKYIYDNNNTKIIISGSSATELSIQSIKYLVGRIFVFNLYPLSFEEYLNCKEKEIYSKIYLKQKFSDAMINKINKHYDKFVIYGGYPRVVLTEDSEEKETVLKNIYNTYFLKEIKEILNLNTDYKLSKLINALALQTNNMISYGELSGISGFKYNEIVEHLNILQKTFICSEYRPYHKNKRTELVKTPKIFFFDNGLSNVVIKNFQGINKRTDEGMLNENFVAAELVKKDIEFNYWRTKSKAEVDFIIRKDSRIYPIEVKSNLNRKKITKSFASFIISYDPKEGIVLSKNILGNKKYEKTNVKFAPIFSIGCIVDQI